MNEEETTRIVTDDFACRVLSDMIRIEEKIVTTALFYGVDCTSPFIVPIPYANGKRDYRTWIAVDATSNIIPKKVTVNVHNEELRCEILYIEQSQLPNWYSNRLLSNESRSLLGNVLLVHLDKEWPKQFIVSPEWIASNMLSSDENADGAESV